MTEYRTNNAVLREELALKNLDVLDVGSGDGTLVRFVTTQGAHVTGLECGAAQLEKARSYPLAGDEVYLEGFGQEMPFDDKSFDLVIFSKSLHHIPVEHMATALAEAKRVVRSGGAVYVAEPIAKGSGFELNAPIDDETFVWSAAYDTFRSDGVAGLRQVREIYYDTVYHYDNFAAFKDATIRIEPKRRVAFEAMEAELRKLFDNLGVPLENGMRFNQAMRVNVLERT